MFSLAFRHKLGLTESGALFSGPPLINENCPKSQAAPPFELGMIPGLGNVAISPRLASWKSCVSLKANSCAYTAFASRVALVGGLDPMPVGMAGGVPCAIASPATAPSPDATPTVTAPTPLKNSLRLVREAGIFSSDIGQYL